MSESYFKVKKVTDFNNITVDEVLPTSDFTCLTNDGKFVQLEFFEEQEKSEPYKVNPGLYTIIKTPLGLKLKSTTFVKDKILPTFTITQKIIEKIDCFFSRLEVYIKYGIEIPMRAMLLFGPGGSGKSSSIMLATDKYLADGKTTAVLWPSDQIDPHDVKRFIQNFEYHGVERLILIIEDIGGVEIDQVRMKSTASLLALLDNREKAFTLPTFIIATTNHAENFLGNITNRPGRFADKIAVLPPKADGRKELLKFFSQDVSEELLEKIAHKKFSDFTADHIREVVIRADLHGISVSASMDAVLEEIKEYNKNFDTKKQGSLGIGSNLDDDY